MLFFEFGLSSASYSSGPLFCLHNLMFVIIIVLEKPTALDEIFDISTLKVHMFCYIIYFLFFSCRILKDFSVWNFANKNFFIFYLMLIFATC